MVFNMCNIRSLSITSPILFSSQHERMPLIYVKLYRFVNHHLNTCCMQFFLKYSYHRLLILLSGHRWFVSLSNMYDQYATFACYNGL